MRKKLTYSCGGVGKLIVLYLYGYMLEQFLLYFIRRISYFLDFHPAIVTSSTFFVNFSHCYIYIYIYVCVCVCVCVCLYFLASCLMNFSMKHNKETDKKIRRNRLSLSLSEEKKTTKKSKIQTLISIRE